MPHPRTQTLIIFIVCLIIVALAAFYAYRGTGSLSSSEQQHLIATTPLTGETLALASSTDWRAQFFEAGTTTAAYKASGSAATGASLTATDQLGRQFFTKYMQLKQAGLNANTQAINDAATQLAADALASVQGPKIYKTDDVIISSDLSAPAMKAYGNKIMSLLLNRMPEKNEAEAAAEAFDKADMGLLRNIDPIIASYQSLRSGLLATPVPRPVIQSHLDLLNGVSIQVFNAQSLRRADVDPVSGLAAVSLDLVGLQNINGALGNIQKYFVSIGVPFGY